MSVCRSFLHRQHRKTSGESLQNFQWQLMKYHFRDCWQVAPLEWNMPANSKGGLEHPVDVRKVCATASHHSVEDEGNFRLLKTCLFSSTLLICLIQPLVVLLASGNENAATMALFPLCQCTSGTIVDHPTCNSKSKS